MSSKKKEPDSRKCIKCDVFLRKIPGIKIPVKTENDAKMYTEFLQKTVTVNDILCNKCKKFINLKMKEKVTTSSEKPAEVVVSSAEMQSDSQTTSLVTSSQSSTQDPTVVYNFASLENSADDEMRVEMPFQRTISVHKFCFICRATKNITRVPVDARLQSFTERRIFIPSGNRCCPNHLIKNRFFADDLKLIEVYSSSSTIYVSDLAKFLDLMSMKCDSAITDNIADFSLSEERLKVFTGLSWENLNQLKEMMVSMRNSKCRNIIQAIVVFLFKLRSGNSNAMIAAILGLEREQQVSDYCSSVLNSFEKDILSTSFGLKAICRNDLINNHTSATAKKLHNIENQLVLIFDGTYIYHEKSSNNEYQRKSYSGQKKKPLCKPFTICTTDGYVLDMAGPFNANQNDAQIMKTVLSDPNGLRSLLNEGDICVVDRGFRDVKGDLEDLGYRVLMPALKGNRSQLTTIESNNSRLVTKIRWVVEAVHGIIKQKYHLLQQTLDNKLLSKVGLYCRIACFLNNMFGKRLNSDLGMSDEIVSQIASRNNVENTLALEVETQKWSRRKLPFQQLTSADLLDFPEMTLNDLKILFTGSYQLSQAVSYLAEMINDDNTIDLQYLKNIQNSIIKVLVRSRHINKKKYKCYIHYDPNTTGHRGILRYACECANGLRTIGCCAHISSIVYYLSYARYQSKIIKPAQTLTHLFDVEEVNPVINDDSDDD